MTKPTGKPRGKKAKPKPKRRNWQRELAKLRVGLLTHAAAIAPGNISTARVVATTMNLVALFGPEHGFAGAAQDLIAVGGERPFDGIPCHSLYGDTVESLKPTPAMLSGLDVLLIDLMDVGSRYYTFQTTMLYMLEACAAAKLPVLILDRTNPIGEEVEGPTIRPGFESFVGPHPIAIRHGHTLGELARLYCHERDIQVDLSVAPYAPEDEFADFLLPPSPNMPSVRTAFVYPGACLFEGTNLSEGRGTTRPFEFVGHPGLSPERFADELNEMYLPGVTFLPITFRPTFHKHAGLPCGGCAIVPTDPERFFPVRTGLAVVMTARAQLGDQFRWRTERYEFVDHIPAFDLLMGSDRERLAIEAGVEFDEIVEPWAAEELAFAKRADAVETIS
jgi:uncharacterized protein YbbC (DUF1343 family)